jgi:hypothetical protein
MKYLNSIFLYRCPKDDTVRYHSSRKVDSQRFSLEAFKFISNHPFLFIHCRVRICNGSDSQSRCARGCESRGRGRRAAEDHHLYGLSEGPFLLDNEDGVNNKQEKSLIGKSKFRQNLTYVIDNTFRKIPVFSYPMVV